MSSRLDKDPAYQEFLDWIHNSCQPGLIDPASDAKPRMLDAHVLQAYFAGNNHYKLNKLLRIIFRGEEVPVDADKVAKDCAQVFCTLLLIGKPEYIQRFVEYDHLQDSHLPFDDQYPPANFPKCTADRDPSEFLRRFCQEQWTVCAPKIDFQEHRIFQDGRILPIKIKKRLGGGGSAILYEIEIHPAYNQLAPSNGAPQSSDHRMTNTYVLKTYFGRDAERYYRSEVTAFKRLRMRTNNMIGFYGGFKHGDRYNIILEFADIGNLEDYFKKAPPPTTGEDIIMFWEHLFKLIEALLFVHEGEIMPNSDGTSQPLHGWHQDVKPSNILVTTLGGSIESPYQWLFKLADLGVSHFKTFVSSTEDDTDGDSQGTHTYGAPECCRPDETLGKSKIKVTQTVDVWSLGAVFSEAAVWLVESYQSLKLYRRDRRTAANNFPDVKGTDCFHDGQEMLEIVPRWHKRLKGRLRKDDLITGQVLDMVECMLHDERSRSKTRSFWTWSQRILEGAKENLKERKVGSDPNTPTKPRPPTSSSISDSTSSAQSYPDVIAENVGPFGDLPRVLSPPTFHDTDRFDQMDMVGQLGRTGSQRDNRPQVTARYPQSNRQVHPRNVTFSDSANATLGQVMGSHANTTHHFGPAQPHQVTQSMSGFDVRRDDVYDQSSSGRINASRNAVSMPPGTSGQYGDLSRMLRGETFDSVGTRHTQESFPKSTYSQTDFNQERGLPGNYFQGSFDEGPSGSAGPSRTQMWPQENPPQQQHANVSSANYDAYIGDNGRGMSMGYWNPPTASAGRPGPASPTPHQTSTQQQVEDFPTNYPESRIEGSHQVNISNSQIAPSRFPPSETTSARPEISNAVSHKSKHKPPAVLQIGTAISGLKKGKVYTLEGYLLLFSRLKQRDHVFILDDALSMLDHWDDVETVFEVLAKMVKSADPDGIDLHFTMSDEVYNSKKWGVNSSSKLVGHVRDRRSKIRGSVNITYRLDAILGPYIAKLTNAYPRGGTVRPLNLYVLTDGVWEPECDPSSAVKNLVDKLRRFGYSKDSKQVGIQFISFGKNKDGLKRLKDLDDNLGQEMDIVDTTPSYGNVWKMLLGAIDRTFDES